MNRLRGAASAYLASAAHQPVHWYPWGEEAFAVARTGDKPVLLDIGAVWCHWCHVMDHESYEDANLAAYLNEHFVCVKADRDERPDVDARYQRAVQALAGQGGWPLTAFLTPDGDVFYGGTYYPPDGKYGQPGFRSVLERILEVYRQQRAKVADTARQLRAHVGASLIEGGPGEIAPGLLEVAADRMARLFDFRYGGFGAQPKFPHPSAVEFLLARWWDTRQPWLREIVEKTLTGMAQGGVYDQIGGGFHRYSMDERWIVPHFEKMSYDNAELLKAYAHGYAALGIPLYREIADGILAWSFEVLADRERGGFAASQDADAGPGDDGDYFTWTPEEARAALSEEEREVARRRWDIYPEGEMHHNPRKNVLWAARSVQEIVEELKVEGSKVEELKVQELLANARAKMRDARGKRPAPFVDRTLYVGWNAMMAEAFLNAGAILGRDDCAAFALETLDRLWSEALTPGAGLQHRPGSDAPPLLEDQVEAASAAIAAYEHTGQSEWLDRAAALVDFVLHHFRDPDAGGFYDVAGVGGTSFASQRSKSVQDSPTPAPNAVAALVLLRMYAITEDERYRTEAERTLTTFAGGAAELGIHGATYFRAVDWLVGGDCRIVVADTTTSGTLARTALAAYRPRKVVVHHPLSPFTSHVSPLTSHLSPPFALVCSGRTCAEPVTTAEALRATLEAFRNPV